MLEHHHRPDEARRYSAMSADQGHPAGRRGLGFILLTGHGDEADIVRAVELLSASAEDGDAYAAFNLGVLYRTGEMVAADHDRARTWFERAAGLGSAAGAARLADDLTADGDHQQARAHHLFAAERGVLPAMYAVAQAYRDGIGGPVDRVQAVRWFLRTLNLDSTDSPGMAQAVSIAAQMTVGEIRQAARLAGRPGDAQTLIRQAYAAGSNHGEPTLDGPSSLAG